MTFSHELRRRRKKMNLSLREAAKQMGALSHSQLGRYERGICLMEMSAEKAEALAKFFEWDAGDMLRKMQRQTRKQKKEASCVTSK